MFNVAIIGAEGFNDYNFCQEKCINCLRNKANSGEPITIFTTGDAFVDAFSLKYHINVMNFFTDWKRFGKDALKYRNAELLKNCDALIFFDDQTKDSRIIYENAKYKKCIPTRYYSK